MDPFIGEIRIFGFNFPPQDWAYCNGQQLPVSQYQALYSLIGAIYGSNGSQPTAFNLPNLQSQTVMGANPMGDGDSQYLNRSSGAEKVLLTEAQLPNHTHAMGGEITSSSVNFLNTPGNTALPNGVFIGATSQKVFVADSPNTYFSPYAISAVGGNGTHENRQPFLTFNFCICTDGIYPNFP